MTTRFAPSEDQEILTDESNFSAEVEMGSQFDMSNDMPYSDVSPEDQGFNDKESKKIFKEAKKRGDGGSNEVFYDSGNTPSEDQSFIEEKKKEYERKKYARKYGKKYDKKDDSNPVEDQYFGEESVDESNSSIFYDSVDTPSEDQSFIEEKKKEYERKKYARKYGKKYDSNPAEDQYFGEESVNESNSSSIYDITPPEDQYVSTEARRPPRIYRPIERRGRAIDDTYQDILVGETLGQDYDNDTLPYSIDQNIDLSKRNYNFGFSNDRTRENNIRRLRASLRGNSNVSPDDQYLGYGEGRYSNHDSEYGGGRYPMIYRDPPDEDSYEINDTYTDVLFGPILGQDYDNDGVPYALESSEYGRADQIPEAISRLRALRDPHMSGRPIGYVSRTPPQDQIFYERRNNDLEIRRRENDVMESANEYGINDNFSSEMSIRPPEIYMDPEYPRGTKINNTYNDIIFNDTLGQDYDDDGVPYALETRDIMAEDYAINFEGGGDTSSDRLRELRRDIRDSINSSAIPEDQYISESSIRPPEIHMNPEYPRGTKINNTYNDIIFNDTLGQDYDDDGVPYALETRDIMAADYDISFEGGGDTRSDRLRELRREIRNSINSSAMPEDQYFSQYDMYNNRDMAALDNPFDATTMDPSMRPRIYSEKDHSKYPEDDTIADVVFGDTLGQDYDNDGIPYALETTDRMDDNYSYGKDYKRDKYKSKEYMMRNKDIMDDNYGSVFEGKSRENAIGNIKRNLGNRFRDSTNDTIASEIARNRLSQRLETSDNAERASERARILADARSLGRGRNIFNNKRKGERERIDNYVMGDYEPSPAAALAGNYDYEGALLSNGVAARAMREARSY